MQPPSHTGNTTPDSASAPQTLRDHHDQSLCIVAALHFPLQVLTRLNVRVTGQFPGMSLSLTLCLSRSYALTLACRPAPLHRASRCPSSPNYHSQILPCFYCCSRQFLFCSLARLHDFPLHVFESCTLKRPDACLRSAVELRSLFAGRIDTPGPPFFTLNTSGYLPTTFASALLQLCAHLRKSICDESSELHRSHRHSYTPGLC